MNTDKKLILITNDDGIDSKGIHALIDFLSPLGDIICMAPDGPRSAQSMALTIHKPLYIRPEEDYHGAKMYSVNGTPVDCIKLSAHHILPRRPDMLASGINHGSNSSINVLYSGTMGAVMEGCQLGIPSVGFSLTSHDPDADFSACRGIITEIAKETLQNGLPDGICLNVNIPADIIPKGIKITIGGRGDWNDVYKEIQDPEGKTAYMLGGDFHNADPDNERTDEWALAHGYASVTPTLLDRTSPIVPEWLSSLK